LLIFFASGAVSFDCVKFFKFADVRSATRSFERWNCFFFYMTIIDNTFAGFLEKMLSKIKSPLYKHARLPGKNLKFSSIRREILFLPAGCVASFAASIVSEMRKEKYFEMH